MHSAVNRDYGGSIPSRTAKVIMKSVKDLLNQAKLRGNSGIPMDAEEHLLPSSDLSPKALVGLSKEEAEKVIVSHGMFSRVTCEDGKWFLGAADVRPDRVNLELKGGKVVNAAIG